VEKLGAADLRVDVAQSKVTDLVIEDAPETDIARAKADHVAAVADRDGFQRALDEAERRLTEEKVLEDMERVEKSLSKITSLMKQRAKHQNAAQAAFATCLDELDAAENDAIEIRNAGAGARGVGNALNTRISNLGAWLITTFYERNGSPEMDQAIGGAIANHHQAREQLAGKSLADLDPDYAELYRQHHAAKRKGQDVRAA